MPLLSRDEVGGSGSMAPVTRGDLTPPIKDGERERPVPEVWRPTLSAIVESLAREDVIVATEVPGVEPVSEALSEMCLEAVAEYGGITLVPLPKDAWDTSVCLWQGDRWQCLVDLWTAQEGRCDLVLDVDVFEDDSGYRYSVNLVYVP
ncbi:hypothetical protein [Nocardioides sp. YIM 152588]|uniref:DUF7668 domain-containing protein n=1 Tax=Nocardioides sp. YIM 152588 TaxID=3158259 RepID=UPI0032E3F216